MLYREICYSTVMVEEELDMWHCISVMDKLFMQLHRHRVFVWGMHITEHRFVQEESLTRIAKQSEYFKLSDNDIYIAWQLFLFLYLS